MRNSSYSFILILLKLYKCCDHALKICICFGYSPQINFCHFFCNLNSNSHFSGILTMKVNGQWVPCVRNSSYSFMPIHLKLYMCYGHGLWFGYNPWIIFCHLFHNLNFFGHFSEWIEGTLCAQLLLQFNTDTLKLCRHCDHTLKICMWLGYTPQINYCHFFLQFELSHFLDIFTS